MSSMSPTSAFEPKNDALGRDLGQSFGPEFAQLVAGAIGSRSDPKLAPVRAYYLVRGGDGVADTAWLLLPRRFVLVEQLGASSQIITIPLANILRVVEYSDPGVILRVTVEYSGDRMSITFIDRDTDRVSFSNYVQTADTPDQAQALAEFSTTLRLSLDD